MAISLNLTVGVLGELSLGHAGFMSAGAFSGIVVASVLSQNGGSEPVILLISMLVGGVVAAIVGVIVGVPVLRLQGTNCPVRRLEILPVPKRTCTITKAAITMI